MRRGLVAFITLTLVGLGLTGCGLFRFEQREPWRAQAEEACLAQHLVQPSAYMSRSSKIEGPGACGMDYPFKVDAFATGSIGVAKRVTLACPIIPRIDTWLEEVVKPAAMMYFGVPVVDLQAGTYSCRPRNNQRGAKLSEHSFGNAMDIMAFILADGRSITVVKGWRGDPVEQDFLREVFVGACRHFTTVLGPGADTFHYDHLHIDLARHDPRGERRICKPILKFTPRLDVARADGRQQPWNGPAAELAPVDVEEDAPVDDLPAERLPPARRAAAPPPPAPAAAYPPVSPPMRPSAPYPPAPLPANTLYPPAPLPRPGGESARAPVYNRPPMPAQPQIMNGHGIY